MRLRIAILALLYFLTEVIVAIVSAMVEPVKADYYRPTAPAVIGNVSRGYVRIDRTSARSNC